MDDTRETADRLYDCFRADVITLSGQHRKVFAFKTRGLATIKLLCTGLLARDGERLLGALDRLSYEYARTDSIIPGETRHDAEDRRDSVARLRTASVTHHAQYQALSEAFRRLMDVYRGRRCWYKTPPGLCSALYAALRLKHQTARCGEFEARALELVPTLTSFPSITVWHRWVAGLLVCLQCQTERAPLYLCPICENALYCSLRCKKRNAATHKNYCRTTNWLERQRHLAGC